MKIVSSFILVVLYLTSLTPAVLGQPVFTWAAHAWPAATLTQTYNGVGGGNNLTFTVSGSTGGLNQFNGTGPNTPGTYTGAFGGFASTTAMILAMDQPNLAASVTNSFTFSNPNGVKNLSFTMFDIDRGSTGGSHYQDQITVNAYRNNILLPGVVTVTAHGADNTFVGNVVTGSASANDATSAGNATFQTTIGTIIDRIDIIYGNGPNATNPPSTDPTQQWVFLSDISFVSVPEPSTIFLLVGTPALMGSAWYFRNRKKLEKKAADLAAAGNTAEAGEQEENAVVAGV